MYIHTYIHTYIRTPYAAGELCWLQNWLLQLSINLSSVIGLNSAHTHIVLNWKNDHFENMGILCRFYIHICKCVCRHKPIVCRMKLAPQPGHLCLNSTCKDIYRTKGRWSHHWPSIFYRYATFYSNFHRLKYSQKDFRTTNLQSRTTTAHEYLCVFVCMWCASLTMTLFSCVNRSVTMNGMMFALTTSCTISCVLSAMKAKAQQASVLISRSGCWTR